MGAIWKKAKLKWDILEMMEGFCHEISHAHMSCHRFTSIYRVVKGEESMTSLILRNAILTIMGLQQTETSLQEPQHTFLI
jgi:hypothetical protein